MVFREDIRPPKFAGKFALLDFDADPMPVIAMFPPPAPCGRDHLMIDLMGEDLVPWSALWHAIEGLPVVEEEAPLVCQIFNWHEVLRWRGVRLRDFLDAMDLDVHPEGFYAFHSRDGHYFEVLSRDEARDPRALVAFGLNGGPLPHEYGGPLRLVVPFLQGYKSVKWLSGIRAYRHDPVGIKRLLGQSKSGQLGQAWTKRLGIEPVLRAHGGLAAVEDVPPEARLPAGVAAVRPAWP
jgi:hypothetical protein